MRKMLTAGVAGMMLTAVALVPVQAMGSTPESTTPVVAATQSYDRQMAQERASRDKVRESVEKHQKAVKTAKAKAEKEKEAKVEAARLKQEKLDKAWLAYLADQKKKREATAKVVAAEAKKKEARAKVVERVYTPKKTTKTYTPEPKPTKTYTPDPPKQASYGSPKAYAQSQLSASQFACLNLLWMKESGWNVYANNPSSGAYGIPQSLPGSKMASAGSDWQTNGITQVKWGLSYISSVYGTPCAAWGHSQAVNWY